MFPFQERNNLFSYYETDDIFDVVGEGSFATVYKAKCLFDDEQRGLFHQGDMVALKVFDKEKMDEKKAKDVINEVEILRHVKHQNCVKLVDVFQTQTKVFVVMNFIPGDELFSVLKRGSLSEERARHMICQLLSALEYLHSNGVVHRDIKPENILVSDDVVTLVDFGLSRVIGKQSRRLGRAVPYVSHYPPRSASVDSLDHSDSPFLATPCGTVKYAAPETIKSMDGTGGSSRNGFNTTPNLLPKIDIYSVGILLYVMLSGRLPFDISGKYGALYKQMENGPSFENSRWENISEEAKDLTRALLRSNPDERPSASEALRHQWFSCNSFSQQVNECAPVDEALGERKYLTEAFGAMRPPEYEIIDKMEEHSYGNRGRVYNVPFSKPTSYFDL
ncbi:protein kinase [Angomonas deanei]|uniref:non-specific serine/threonine protein kinase n=1 Tax=Angomonas deanei TaxID=59799 RepID=A0A7G2CRX4_9TRYP|nr:protein kinase [Angomonas deanei]CAD2222510.1 Protein kinase domain/Protein tyrosine kinase/RIO1 family, putative [Angomonas deanei]|eukprot:EPY24195.1 protein kinase [Angomonas deanei]